MNTKHIVDILLEERAKIENAIHILAPVRRGRPRKVVASSEPELQRKPAVIETHSRWTPEMRKAQSERIKASWRRRSA